MKPLTISLLSQFAGLLGRNAGSSPEADLSTMRLLTKQALSWRKSMMALHWIVSRKMPAFSVKPGDALYMGVARPALRLMSSVLTRGPLSSDKDSKYSVYLGNSARFVRKLGATLQPHMYFRDGIAHMFEDVENRSVYGFSPIGLAADLLTFEMALHNLGRDYLRLEMGRAGGELVNCEHGFQYRYADIHAMIDVAVESGEMRIWLKHSPPLMAMNSESQLVHLTAKADDDDPASFCGEKFGK